MKIPKNAKVITDKKDWQEFWDSGDWKTQPFKIIDTNPVEEHTALCSCDYCMDMKKLFFADPPPKLREGLKGTILERVLIQDGLWKEEK